MHGGIIVRESLPRNQYPNVVQRSDLKHSVSTESVLCTILVNIFRKVGFNLRNLVGDETLHSGWFEKFKLMEKFDREAASTLVVFACAEQKAQRLVKGCCVHVMVVIEAVRPSI